jgi:hypothetical protein
VRALERVAILVVSLAVAAGLIALLSGFFANRDIGSLSGSSGGPGQAFPDLGDAVLAPGELRPPYSSDPPTSGAHIPMPISRDGRPLSDDQLLTALAAGNVVLLYGRPASVPALRALARSVAGRFSPALLAAGQAVILSPRSGASGVIAVAWDHLLRVSGPNDPRLRAFVAFWLGRVGPAR